MKSKLVALTCRQCMYHTYRKSETLILSDFETQAREDLLNNTYFTMRCPSCGNLIQFIHPLAYVDTIHKFILLIKSKKDFHEEDTNLYSDDPNSIKRFLSNPTHIGEKIRIFEDGLDDRAIEILKVQLKKRYEKQSLTYSINYHDVDKTTQTLWFTIQNKDVMEYIAIMFDTYETIRKQLINEYPTMFKWIDETWALAYIETKT